MRWCQPVRQRGLRGRNGRKGLLFLNGSAQISITLAARRTPPRCDRAAVSGSLSDVSFTDNSKVLYTPLTGAPDVPEVPYAVLLPLVAMVLNGAGIVRARRRQADAPSAAS